MDSKNETKAAANYNKCDRESGTPKNCKGTSKQRGQGDCDENVFTSMSHETDSGLYPQNGPRDKTSNTTHNKSETLNRIDNPDQQRNKDTQMTNNIINTSANLDSVGTTDTNSRDNGVESNHDKQTCQKHKVCLGNAGTSYNFNAPSTSGASLSKACESVPEPIELRENRKRPSSLKLNKANLDADESSSDTGNDDYSLGSEDGCIYTYRGGEHLADLPSSFFSLDMGLPLDKHLPMPPNYQAPGGNVREHGSRASSPDMDFLEMDFDPGPSCEVDTGDEVTPDEDLESANMPEESEQVRKSTSPEILPGPEPIAIAGNSKQSQPSEVELHYCNPSTSRGAEVTQSLPDNARPVQTFGPYITHVNFRGEHLLVRRSMAHSHTSQPVSLHVSSGDLISPQEVLNYEEEHAEAPFAHQTNQGERPSFDSNLSSALYHLTMAKKLMKEEIKLDIESQDADCVKEADKPVGSWECSVGCVEVPRCMVWSEREACERQVTQISTSACGATAVVNVFIALGVPVNIEKINSSIGTRLRANDAPIPRYLLSRAAAGCTAAELAAALARGSGGLVSARFFPTHPERALALGHWLADWISLGAVPILTLNPQMGCEGEIPDAWHHRMAFGVSPRGVYLTNPIECVRESALWPRLTSPSVLLVRTADVLARFTADADLTPLMAVPDRRFHTFNVLGQVATAVRERSSAGWSRARHVVLPASYRAGVTVAALTGSEAHRRLRRAPAPPALAPGDSARPPAGQSFRNPE